MGSLVGPHGGKAEGLAGPCNIPDVTVTKIRIMASSALHSMVVKYNLMHQLKMSLIWLNVLRELKCVYLV